MLVKKWNKIQLIDPTWPIQNNTQHTRPGQARDIYQKKNMFQHVYLCCCSHSLLYIKLTIYLLKYYY